jgi:hypothetical protein
VSPRRTICLSLMRWTHGRGEVRGRGGRLGRGVLRGRLTARTNIQKVTHIRLLQRQASRGTHSRGLLGRGRGGRGGGLLGGRGRGVLPLRQRVNHRQGSFVEQAEETRNLRPWAPGSGRPWAPRSAWPWGTANSQSWLASVSCSQRLRGSGDEGPRTAVGLAVGPGVGSSVGAAVGACRWQGKAQHGLLGTNPPMLCSKVLNDYSRAWSECRKEAHRRRQGGRLGRGGRGRARSGGLPESNHSRRKRT